MIVNSIIHSDRFYQPRFPVLRTCSLHHNFLGNEEDDLLSTQRASETLPWSKFGSERVHLDLPLFSMFFTCLSPNFQVALHIRSLPRSLSTHIGQSASMITHSHMMRWQGNDRQSIRQHDSASCQNLAPHSMALSFSALLLIKWGIYLFGTNLDTLW